MRLRDVTKAYGTGAAKAQVLRGVSFDIDKGELIALVGQSGSGKSTLLNIIGGLHKPDAGEVEVMGIDTQKASDNTLAELRNRKMGFVFQAFNLLPTLTAEENITLPADLAGRPVDRAWFDTVVSTLGLQERLTHRPAQLSGGQQQRTAVARALVSRPEVVFADEPSGALDSKASAELLAFLRSVVDGLGQTVVMVTHDPVAAAYADRVVFLVDGSVVEELAGPTRDSVLETMKQLGG